MQEYGSIEMPLTGGPGYKSFMVLQWGESVVPNTEYLLISIGWLEYWIVAEVVGARYIDGERALEVSKVSTLTTPRDGQFDAANGFENEVKGRRQLIVYI